jgi:ADP-ribosylglycohydrolase
VTKVLSETVAMGLDNDCTAATAGSIVGAIVGPDGIPPHWTRPFHNKIITYLEGKRRFTISGVINRFARQAARVWKTA